MGGGESCVGFVAQVAFAGGGDGLVEFRLQGVAGGEDGQVFGDVDAAFVQFEEFDLFLFFAGTEDEAEGGGFVGFLFVAG